MKKEGTIPERPATKHTFLYCDLNDVAVMIESENKYWTVKTREGDIFRVDRLSEFAGNTLINSVEITSYEYNMFEFNDCADFNRVN
jgi:hypothetical protein